MSGAVSAPPPFAWSVGSVHLETLAGVLLLTGLYTWALLRRPSPVALRQPLAFFAAGSALLLTLNGPLHDLSDVYLFSAHMVQHLVLTLVVAPLWLVGTPAFVIDPLLERMAAWPLIGRAVATVTRPLPALALYTVAMVGWHLPDAYNLALDRHGWHIVQHLVLLATGVLAWWPILSPSRRFPALPYAAQLLYLFVFGIPMTIVAAFVTSADRLLYPAYAAAPRVLDLTPLADQRLGGVIMWVPAGIIPLVAFTVVFFRWVAAEADEVAS